MHIPERVRENKDTERKTSKKYYKKSVGNESPDGKPGNSVENE